MSLQSILIYIIIGGIAGWLAGRFVKRGVFGPLGYIILGIVGGFVGGWVFAKLGVPVIVNDIVSRVVESFAGAAAVLLLIGVLRR